MLGPASGVATAARRRARRRKRVFVLASLLFVFVVGELVHEVVNAARPSSRRTAGTWVADVAPVVADTNTLGRTVAYVESSGPAMERPQLVLVLGSIVGGARSDAASVGSDPLAPPAPADRSRLVRALSLRASALADLELGVTDAIDGMGTTASRGVLGRVAPTMRQAERAYRAFVARLPRGSDPSQLPRVSWTTPSSLFSPQTLGKLAQRLGASGRLRPQHRLAIAAIALSPLPEVVPSTSTVTSVPTTTVPRRSGSSKAAAGSGTRGSGTRGSGTKGSGTKGSGTKASGTKARSSATGSAKRTHPTTTVVVRLPTLSQIPTGTAPSVFAPTATIQPLVVIRNDGNVTETGVVVEATFNGKTVRSAPIAALSPGGSRYLQLDTLAVVTRAMAACRQRSLAHDRCGSLRVRLVAHSGFTTQRRVALAFFVA